MTAAFRTSSFMYKGNRLVYDEYGEGERLVGRLTDVIASFVEEVWTDRDLNNLRAT